MKKLACIALAASMASSAHAGTFTLDKGYVRPDGAIMSYYNVSNFIDPYFPTKALLTAHDSGMNIKPLAQGWINWLMSRQESDGLISRFCKADDASDYQACLIADADDSMMALWIELLYRMAPQAGLPREWKHSAAKAQTQLDALFDTKSNVYFISKAMPVGLLMDNVEIYAALKRAGAEARRIGELKQSAAFYAKAERLKAGIVKTFWDEKSQRFRITTQERNANDFYPDKVAQMIPLLHGFQSASTGSPEATYHRWMQAHQKEWMDLIGKEYPWGLVAVVATERKDIDTASCWLKQVAPHRHTGTWDIVDEAAFQAVEFKLQKQSAGADACAKAAS